MKESILEYLLNNKEINFLDKSFRKNQILDFIFQKRDFDFKNYSNIPCVIREQLQTNFDVLKLSPELEKISKDGTRKYLFKLFDNNYIESVSLKDNNNRNTFCISTQCGCKMNCSICQTAKMGFKRNLDYIEIISQILFLLQKNKKLDNIVFMGMGEPLDNIKNLITSIKVINSFLKFSTTRITVSTCGIYDKLDELIENFPNIRLAVSLNASVQEKREKIMPISKSYPLKELLFTLDRIFEKNHNRITLEYVLIKNFNMLEEDIEGFKQIKRYYHINLIPYNSKDENVKPDVKSVNIFYKKLLSLGFNVTIRVRRGADIQADCGQLYYDFKSV